MKRENLVLDPDFFVGFSKSTHDEDGNFTGFVEIIKTSSPLIERMEEVAYRMIKNGMIPEKGDKLTFNLRYPKEKDDETRFKFPVVVTDVEYTITTQGEVIWINIVGQSLAFEYEFRQMYDEIYRDLDKKREGE